MDNSQSLGTSIRTGFIQDLMEEVLTIEKESEVSKEAIDRLKEIVIESENIIEQTRTSSDMIIDGKILSSGGHIVRSHVQKFETNLTQFSPEEYTGGVISYLKNNSSDNEIDWTILASETFAIFKKIAGLDYKLGTFQLDPPPPPEKPRVERQKKANISSKTVVSAIDAEGTEESAEQNDEIYQHIQMCMVRHYKRNKRQPIEYIKFVIDPTDYWTSVHNIFNFSFLVRDAKVKMFLNDKGLPVFEPVINAKDSENRKSLKNSQFSFRITPIEWRKFIDVFEITEPAISPFNPR